MYHFQYLVRNTRTKITTEESGFFMSYFAYSDFIRDKNREAQRNKQPLQYFSC